MTNSEKAESFKTTNIYFVGDDIIKTSLQQATNTIFPQKYSRGSWLLLLFSDSEFPSVEQLWLLRLLYTVILLLLHVITTTATNCYILNALWFTLALYSSYQPQHHGRCLSVLCGFHLAGIP